MAAFSAADGSAEGSYGSGGVAAAPFPDGAAATSLAVDADGDVLVAGWAYTGRDHAATEMAVARFTVLYQGLRLDVATGTYDSHKRVYIVRLGRFGQQDPAGYVDGPDRYQFTLGNPVDHTDPTGELSWGAVFAGVGIGCLVLAAGIVAAPVLLAAAVAATPELVGAGVLSATGDAVAAAAATDATAAAIAVATPYAAAAAPYAGDALVSAGLVLAARSAAELYSGKACDGTPLTDEAVTADVATVVTGGAAPFAGAAEALLESGVAETLGASGAASGTSTAQQFDAQAAEMSKAANDAKTYEWAMNNDTGEPVFSSSGWNGTPLSGLTQPPQSLEPPRYPSSCAMPQASQGVIVANNGLVPSNGITVSNGGYITQGGVTEYIAPCRNCDAIVNLNPFVTRAPLPIGIPSGLDFGERFSQ